MEKENIIVKALTGKPQHFFSKDVVYNKIPHLHFQSYEKKTDDINEFLECEPEETFVPQSVMFRVWEFTEAEIKHFKREIAKFELFGPGTVTVTGDVLRDVKQALYAHGCMDIPPQTRAAILISSQFMQWLYHFWEQDDIDEDDDDEEDDNVNDDEIDEEYEKENKDCEFQFYWGVDIGHEGDTENERDGERPLNRKLKF